MMQFNRFEVIGISTALVVVVLGFAAVHYMSLNDDHSGIETAQKEDRTVQLPADTGENRAEVARTLVSGLSSSGAVTELVVQDIQTGSGAVVEEGDVVTLRYAASLTDGTALGGTEPVTFPVGSGEMIEGFEQGVLGMRTGGVRTLIVPPELAYGNHGNAVIPRDATILFVVELLEVHG